MNGTAAPWDLLCPEPSCESHVMPTADRRPSPFDRFAAKVDKDGPGGCWIWTGVRNNNGYGYLFVTDRKVYVHRFSYEHFVGPIPEGLVIDHLCRNRPCVNPDHLEPVTQAENLRRGPGSKTHCANGHLFTAETTGYQGPGHRYCLVCSRNRKAAKKTGGSAWTAQPREHPVQCVHCKRKTWNVSAICCGCTDRHAAMEAKRDDWLNPDLRGVA